MFINTRLCPFLSRRRQPPLQSTRATVTIAGTAKRRKNTTLPPLHAPHLPVEIKEKILLNDVDIKLISALAPRRPPEVHKGSAAEINELICGLVLSIGSHRVLFEALHSSLKRIYHDWAPAVQRETQNISRGLEHSWQLWEASNEGIEYYLIDTARDRR